MPAPRTSQKGPGMELGARPKVSSGDANNGTVQVKKDAPIKFVKNGPFKKGQVSSC